jgi:hypothetical protein
MIDSSIRRLLVASILAATAFLLYGCASSDADQASTPAATCQGEKDCEARDNARQQRDADDYQNEPALGYLRSPPGLLPVPVTSRNTSAY